MIYLKHTLDWFQFPSLIIDLFSFIVLLMISIVSIKYYKLNKNKKSLYLSVSFLFIALSFMFKLLTNASLFYDKLINPTNTQIIVQTLQTIRTYNIFSNLTFTVFAFLNLIGLYLLYKLYQGKQTYSNVLLMGYFILISTYFSNSNYYIFHLTSFIFLVAISSF